MQSAEQDKKKQEKSSKKDSKENDQGKEKENEQKDAKGEEGQSGDKQSSLPPGVQKVTERIKTETTRDYLGADGKVLGTEKTVNEQVKTVPPEMLKQEQSKDASQEGDQGKEKEKEEGK
ncbi:hypothetical protein [Desulfosporosinus sp.]|uniref:hypothetical protein n=1 Tax=Desulfosporosinus sp. TaxID=157907 RepID=UPI0025BC76BF|nr:hypothetical protein [Desulfosporosinus sp.]MBC2726472.1 hypothetical protein [Desulfosporosinus sp.]